MEQEVWMTHWSPPVCFFPTEIPISAIVLMTCASPHTSLTIKTHKYFIFSQWKTTTQPTQYHLTRSNESSSCGGIFERVPRIAIHTETTANKTPFHTCQVCRRTNVDSIWWLLSLQDPCVMSNFMTLNHFRLQADDAPAINPVDCDAMIRFYFYLDLDPLTFTRTDTHTHNLWPNASVSSATASATGSNRNFQWKNEQIKQEKGKKKYLISTKQFLCLSTHKIFVSKFRRRWSVGHTETRRDCTKI